MTLPAIIPNRDKHAEVNAYNLPIDKIKFTPEKESQYFIKFIEEIYQTVLLRNPIPAEKEMHLNILRQGGSREGIYHSLVLGSEYAKLENINTFPTVSGTNFVIEFYGNFFKQKITRDQLYKKNIYSIKKEITEKILELFESYSALNQRSSIEDWYAIFSSETATSFPMLYKSPIRKNTNANYHQQWAKQVPIEHIKSESIIKMHILLNKYLTH